MIGSDAFSRLNGKRTLCPCSRVGTRHRRGGRVDALGRHWLRAWRSACTESPAFEFLSASQAGLVTVTNNLGGCTRFPLPHAPVAQSPLLSCFFLILPSTWLDQRRPVFTVAIVYRSRGKRSCGICCEIPEFALFSKRDPSSLV